MTAWLSAAAPLWEENLEQDRSSLCGPPLATSPATSRDALHPHSDGLYCRRTDFPAISVFGSWLGLSGSQISPQRCPAEYLLDSGSAKHRNRRTQIPWLVFPGTICNPWDHFPIRLANWFIDRADLRRLARLVSAWMREIEQAVFDEFHEYNARSAISLHVSLFDITIQHL